MSLEEFNKLCDDTLEEYRVELPNTKPVYCLV